MSSGDSGGALPARDSRRGFKGGTHTRVLVVDDYAFVRAGLRAILEAENGLQVVAEADTASAAIGLSARTRPDVAVVAVLPGGRIGAQAINEIRTKSPDTEVLVLTAAGTWSVLCAPSELAML